MCLPKRLSHLDGLENDRCQLQMMPLIIDFQSKFRLGMQKLILSFRCGILRHLLWWPPRILDRSLCHSLAVCSSEGVMCKMFIGGYMSSYITERTVFSHFYQFPDFLLWAPISQTAKLAYMLLYDRARLSQQNDWQDDGRVYLTYPIKNMAAALGKSESTVKDVFNE